MRTFYKVSIALTAAAVVVAGTAGGLHVYGKYQDQKQERAAAEELQKKKDLVADYQDITYGGKSVGEEDLEGLNTEELTGVLQAEAEKYQNRTVSIQVDEDTYSYTMKKLKENIYYSCSDGSEYSLGQEKEIAEKMVGLDKEKDLEDQYEIIKGKAEPTKLQVTVLCKSNKKQLDRVIKKLESRYVIPVTNSHIDEHGRITAPKNGQDLDVKTIRKELKKYLNQETLENYTASYRTTVSEPLWRKKDLRKVNTEISRFSTTFVSTTQRGHNIKVGASRINGTCLLPGESLSFDKAIHDESDGQSFLEAGSYLQGKVVQTEGGGICQISTTAYNAFLQAGIIPVRRYPHSMPVHYVPLGLDAAISAGVKDLEIKNTLDVPILILAQTKGNTLTFSIKSYRGALGEYTYKPRAVQLSSLSAKGYLDIYKNGKRQKSILLHTDRYQSES